MEGGLEGKNDQEDCQGDPEKRGTRRIEGTRRKEIPENCQGDQEKRGTSRMVGTKRREGPRALPRGPGEKRDQQDRGDQKDGGGQKEGVTKRIAKGTRRKEGPGGWRGAEG